MRPVPDRGEVQTRAGHWLERHALAAVVVGQVLGGALFPKVAYWLRWPTRLRPRAFVVYFACRVLAHVVLIWWVYRLVAERARLKERLHERLGREPTGDEVDDEVARQVLTSQLGREPTDEEVAELLVPHRS